MRLGCFLNWGTLRKACSFWFPCCNHQKGVSQTSSPANLSSIRTHHQSIRVKCHTFEDINKTVLQSCCRAKVFTAAPQLGVLRNASLAALRETNRRPTIVRADNFAPHPAAASAAPKPRLWFLAAARVPAWARCSFPWLRVGCGGSPQLLSAPTIPNVSLWSICCEPEIISTDGLC